MTPYDPLYDINHMIYSNDKKTKSDHGESKVVLVQKNVIAKVCHNYGDADCFKVKDGHLCPTRKTLDFQQYGELFQNTHGLISMNLNKNHFDRLVFYFIRGEGAREQTFI